MISTPQHRVKGFTLLELLITLVVAGILASIAVPSFSGFLARQQLRSDVNEVVSMLSFARSEAIKRRVEVMASIGTDDGQWTITVAVAESDKKLRVANGRQSAVSVSGIESVSFNSLGARESCIEEGSEEDTDGDCQIKLTHGGDKAERVTVSPAGGVRSD